MATCIPKQILVMKQIVRRDLGGRVERVGGSKYSIRVKHGDGVGWEMGW